MVPWVQENVCKGFEPSVIPQQARHVSGGVFVVVAFAFVGAVCLGAAVWPFAGDSALEQFPGRVHGIQRLEFFLDNA